MKLLTLLLLLGVASPAVSKVGSFQDCDYFFVPNPHNQNHPFIPVFPEGKQYKQICQFWKEKYMFATLYDTERRIPVYSAYVFNQEHRGFKGEFVWKNEPQLDGHPEDQMNEPGVEDFMNQAMNNDYNTEHEGCRYTKGHVFPRGHAADEDQTDSTYTLTNAAPQLKDNNNDWAKQVEQVIRRHVRKGCKNGEAHIVAGVIPGDEWLPIKRGDETIPEGINIPKHFWSAYFCFSNKNVLKSKAFIAEQKACKADEKIKLQPHEMTTDELNDVLSKYYNQAINVFPGI